MISKTSMYFTKKLMVLVFGIILKQCCCLRILDMMTDEEFHQIFHSERAQVPAHEFVKLNSPSTTQLKRKSSSENRVLSFTAFGHFYDLLLKPRDEVLIGKNTPVWHVRTNPLNSSHTEYTKLPDVMNNLNGIYQDTENMISLIENKLENSGELYYDGMIAPDLAISPIPRRLIQMMSSTMDEKMVEDHVIFKISTDNETIDYEPSDTGVADKKSNQNVYRLFPLRAFYPEILVVVDLSLYKHLGYEPDLAMNYIVPFWNGVDLRYKLLETPEVKLNIAGVILAQDETALQFIYNNLDDSGRVHAKEAILDAGEYFDANADFITKDIIVTMTKRDICSLKYSDYCKSSALGKAFTGKACSRKKNTAIFEDNGGYSGIITAVHEIGHLLGLPHDGEGEATQCPMEDGYIMASAKFRSFNSLCWSACSRKLLKQFSSLKAANCLENIPRNVGDLVTQNLPGKVLSLEEQCRARGGKPCIFNATVCWKLHCTKSMSNMKCVGKAPAAEGSSCGDGMYCRNGDCIEEEIQPRNVNRYLTLA